MAKGDAKSDVLNIGGSSTVTIQPPSGETWKANHGGDYADWGNNGTDNSVGRVTNGSNTMQLSRGNNGGYGEEDHSMMMMHEKNDGGGTVMYPSVVYMDSGTYIEYENTSGSSRPYHLSAIQVN